MKMQDRVVKMFDEDHMTVQDIAKALKISPERVDNILDKADGYEVPTRRDPVPQKTNQPRNSEPLAGFGVYQRRRGPAYGEITVLPRVTKPGEGRTESQSSQDREQKPKSTSRNPSGLGGSKKAAECGTPSGYRKHQRLEEKPCEPCRLAKNKAKVGYYQAKKQREQEEAGLGQDA